MDLVPIWGVFRAGRGVDSGGRRPSGGPWPEWKQSLKSFFGIEREEGWGSLTLQIKACISLSSSSFFHSAPNNTLMDYWCACSVWVHDRSIWGGTLRDLVNKHRNGSFQSKTRSIFMPSHQMAILFYGFEAALYVGDFCPCYLASDLKAIFFLWYTSFIPQGGDSLRSPGAGTG